jgi:hypothetical protein
MDQAADTELDPRDEIVQLEARIEQLAAKIESCRRFILPSRIAIAVGGVLLVAMMFRVIPFDAMLMILSIAAVLGGFVLLGSNSTTAKEAAAQLAAADARRAALIGLIELQPVSEGPTLH